MRTNTFVRKLLSLVLTLAISLFVFLPSGVTPTAFAASKEEIEQRIDELDQKIEASQDKIKENDKKIDSASSSASELQGQVNAVQAQLDAYNQKIDLLNQRIAALNAEISKTESEKAKNEAKMAEQKETISVTQQALAQRLRAMYISGNVSNLEILLEADSFTNFLNRLELVSRIARHDNDIISTLRDEISEYEAIEAKLEEQEKRLEEDKAGIESSKAQEQDAKSEIVSSKKVLDQKMSTLNNYISGLESNSKELQNYITSARQQQQAYMNQINAQLAQSSSTGTGTPSGDMIWPVAASGSYISSGYGSRWGTTHYGIDITHPNGGSNSVPIVASASGVVKISSNACSHNYRKESNCGCNGGYGNYCVIDHGNGLLSYYAHMARSVVSVGQHVEQGQLVGYMGCTGYSTGPHLHFEIRVNDGSSRSVAARNPLNYVRQP